MSRLTIIIPFFADTLVEAFEETLASVLLFRPENTEILIANSTDYADPWNTANDGVRFLSLRNLSNPVDVLNQSLRHATGSVVGILWPGTEVTAQWAESAVSQFDDPMVGIVIPSVFDRRKPKRVFSFGIHYKSGGVLRTIRRSHWAEASGKTIVPHLSAVFFRAETVTDSNDFDRTFIPQFAYADLALSAAERNWKTVVDLESKILVRPNRLPTTSAFAWGIQTERLYFRWFGGNGSVFALGAHFWSFLTDFGRHFPRLKAFQVLSGRLLGLLFFGEMLPVVRRFHNRPILRESETESPTISCVHRDASEAVPKRKSA